MPKIATSKIAMPERAVTELAVPIVSVIVAPAMELLDRRRIVVVIRDCVRRVWQLTVIARNVVIARRARELGGCRIYHRPPQSNAPTQHKCPHHSSAHISCSLPEP